MKLPSFNFPEDFYVVPEDIDEILEDTEKPLDEQLKDLDRLLSPDNEYTTFFNPSWRLHL